MVKKKDDLISNIIGNITYYIVEEIKKNGIFFFKAIIKKAVRKEAVLIVLLLSGIIFLGMGSVELLTTYINKGASYLILGMVLISIGIIQSY